MAVLDIEAAQLIGIKSHKLYKTKRLISPKTVNSKLNIYIGVDQGDESTSDATLHIGYM